MKIAGYEVRPDYARMGLSLLIASAMILAIRTARWPPTLGENLASPELDQEIEYAVLLASRTLSRLLRDKAEMFPTRREPRVEPDDEENPP
jgi:hypothetical protein